MGQDTYQVGAFSYTSKEASDKALKEQNKIMKLESQMDYNNPKVVYSVYCKMIDKMVFETLEGITYLMHIQNYLFDNESFLPGPIPMIPSGIVANAGILGNINVPPTQSENNANANNVSKEDSAKDSKKENNKNNNNEADKDAIIENHLETIKKLSDRNKALHLENKKLKNSSSNTIIYKIIIGFLIIIVGAMLVISLNSNSPNILNYRNEIQNEYSDWEQQLKDKENELNQRERALTEKENN